MVFPEYGCNEVNMLTQSAKARQRGFTLTELVLIIIILGVLSITALPMWFNRTDFEQRGYFDELIQATRYAQKLALASNCDVRININGNSFSLQQPTSYCNTANWQEVSLPGKQPPYNAPGNVTVSAGTGTLTFLASGLATADRTITVTGTSALSFTVHAATGYVERL